MFTAAPRARARGTLCGAKCGGGDVNHSRALEHTHTHASAIHSQLTLRSFRIGGKTHLLRPRPRLPPPHPHDARATENPAKYA